MAVLEVITWMRRRCPCGASSGIAGTGVIALENAHPQIREMRPCIQCDKPMGPWVDTIDGLIDHGQSPQLRELRSWL